MNYDVCFVVGDDSIDCLSDYVFQLLIVYQIMFFNYRLQARSRLVRRTPAIVADSAPVLKSESPKKPKSDLARVQEL